MAGYGGMFKQWLPSFLIAAMIMVYAVGHPVNTHDNGVITFGDEATANTIPVTFDPSKNASSFAGGMAATPSNASNTVNAVKLTLMVRMENNKTAVEVKAIENMDKPTGQGNRTDRKTDSFFGQTDNKHALSISPDTPPKVSANNTTLKNDSFPAQTAADRTYKPSKSPEMQSKIDKGAGRSDPLLDSADKNRFSNSSSQTLASSSPSNFGKYTSIDIASEHSPVEKKYDDWKEVYVAAMEKLNNTHGTNTTSVENDQSGPQMGNSTIFPHALDRNDTDIEDATNDTTDEVPKFAAEMTFSDDELDLDTANATASVPSSLSVTAAQEQAECEEDLEEAEGSGDEDSVICGGTEKDDTEDAGVQIAPDNKGVPDFVPDSEYPHGTIIGLEENLNGHLKDVTNGDEVITIWINLRTGQIVGSTLKSLNRAERALLPVMGKNHVELLSERLKRAKKGKPSPE